MEEIKKVKPIILRDKKTGAEKYTLEFNQDSVRFAEQRGFKIEDVADYSMNKLPEFFWLAFRMHHPRISRAETDKILFEDLKGFPDGMVARLGELYSAPFDALRQDPDVENSENPPTMAVEM